MDDCAKLIAFGTYHTEDLWDYVKTEKNPYGLDKLPLILMPTYPSSGSEYGLGEVSEERICEISIDPVLKKNEISEIIMDSMLR